MTKMNNVKKQKIVPLTTGPVRIDTNPNPSLAIFGLPLAGSPAFAADTAGVFPFSSSPSAETFAKRLADVDVDGAHAVLSITVSWIEATKDSK